MKYWLEPWLGMHLNHGTDYVSFLRSFFLIKAKRIQGKLKMKGHDGFWIIFRSFKFIIEKKKFKDKRVSRGFGILLSERPKRSHLVGSQFRESVCVVASTFSFRWCNYVEYHEIIAGVWLISWEYLFSTIPLLSIKELITNYW